MAASLRFFRAESGAESVDLPECRRGSLSVKLAGLRQIRRSFIEVFCREETSPLPDRRGENRRIDTKETALIVEIVDRHLDFVSHPRNRALALAPQPEGTVIEQIVDPVLLRLDGIVERAQARHRQFSN